MCANLFPEHLAKYVSERWETSVVGPDYDRPPLPTQDQLIGILETCYIASQQTDEGRQLKFSVSCTPRSRELRLHESEIFVESYTFEFPRVFNVQEIRRLATTVNVDSSTIWVRYYTQQEIKLEIIGLLNIGKSWMLARHGFSYGYLSPPSALNIRVTNPGCLAVYQGRMLIGSLIAGKLNTPTTVSVFDVVGMYELIKAGFDKLMSMIEPTVLHLPTMEPTRYESFKERAEFLWTAYINVVFAIVNQIKFRAHGGMLVILPDDFTKIDDLIRIKYKFDPFNIDLQKRFISFAKTRNELVEYLVKSECLNLVDKDTETMLAAKNHLMRIELEKLSNTITFIGDLAGTDGAVIINPSLQILGFGGEILGKAGKDLKVFSRVDTLRKTDLPLDFEQFGMRHRAAIRLCGNYSKAVAFVISQDGHVSLFWSEDDCVYMKQNVNTTNANMVAA